MFRFWLCVFYVLVGPFSFGYGLVHINIPKEALYRDLNLNSDFEQKTVILVFHVGALFFLLLYGRSASKYSHRFFFLLGSICLIVSGFLMSIFPNKILFILGRLFLGFGCSIFLSVTPAYLNEISPPVYKGAAGSFFQLAITIGIFAGVLLTGGPFNESWRFSSFLLFIFGILLLIGVATGVVVTSPFFSYSRNFKPTAIKDFKSLRGLNGQTNKEVEDLLLEESTGVEKTSASSNQPPSEQAATALAPKKLLDSENQSETFFEPFNSEKAISIFDEDTGKVFVFLIIFLQVTQQLSGINLLMQYSENIFKKAGFGNAYHIHLLIAATNFLGAFSTVVVIDYLGRKVLFLLSCIFCALCYALFSVANVAGLFNPIIKQILEIISLVGFIFMFNIGLGPIPWLISAELFSSSHKSMAGFIGTVTNLIFTLLVTFISEPLISALPLSLVFLPFIFWLVMAFFFLLWGLIETRRKKLSEIQKEAKIVYKYFI